MANLRPILLMTLVVLGFMLWTEWQKDYGPRPAPAPATTDTTGANSTADVPAPPRAADLPATADTPPAGDLPDTSALDQPAAVTQTEQPATPAMSGERPMVRVSTDVLELAIDPVGGTLVSARLLDYPVSLDTPQDKVNLLSADEEHLFIAQSGLLSREPAPNHTTPYRSANMEYELAEGADELRVPLTWISDDGLRVTKTFILHRGEYVIGVRHTLENASGETWGGSRYDQLQRVAPRESGGGFSNPERYSFNGIAFYSPDEKFEKLDFDDVADDGFDRSFAGGWLSMVQHYFFAAWLPPESEPQRYSAEVYTPGGAPRYIARAVGTPVQVPAGASHAFESRLYVGPKLQDRLDDIAPGLQHTVNYGIFTVFSKPLFWLLDKIHGVVGNWGWAIVLLTILIKLAFYRLSKAQYNSMARMRKLQPRIEALKERYGDDRQRMSQAMMDLYKKEKVNPLGGCLPILVQIPIFIALYWVLLESVELRQAPFILWIENLSARDPYFILPALNAVFMILTQKLTPTAGMDPMQRKIMNAMPIVFSVMFAFFPAGLVLYWATNAGLSLLQQWWITRQIEAAG
ncbi:MAG: membrane protein insertase YidC [Xanthomonadales bacterium]|nr:membrane protein insertase YidC [Xanthomonadales bacterium]